MLTARFGTDQFVKPGKIHCPLFADDRFAGRSRASGKYSVPITPTALMALALVGGAEICTEGSAAAPWAALL